MASASAVAEIAKLGDVVGIPSVELSKEDFDTLRVIIIII